MDNIERLRLALASIIFSYLNTAVPTTTWSEDGTPAPSLWAAQAKRCQDLLEGAGYCATISTRLPIGRPGQKSQIFGGRNLLGCRAFRYLLYLL